MPKGKPKQIKLPELDVNETLSGRNSSPTLLGAATASGSAPLVHTNVAVLEFVNAGILNEVMRATNLKEMVVRRLSDTVVIIDHQHQEEFVKLLTKKGYEPKILAN